MFFRIQASFEDFKFLVRFIKKTQKKLYPNLDVLYGDVLPAEFLCSSFSAADRKSFDT